MAVPHSAYQTPTLTTCQIGIYRIRSATWYRILLSVRCTIALTSACAKTLPICTYIAPTLSTCQTGIYKIRSATWCRILPSVRCTIVLISAYARTWPICTYAALTKHPSSLLVRTSTEKRDLLCLGSTGFSQGYW